MSNQLNIPQLEADCISMATDMLHREATAEDVVGFVGLIQRYCHDAFNRGMEQEARAEVAARKYR